jgi:hypothetical protein
MMRKLLFGPALLVFFIGLSVNALGLPQTSVGMKSSGTIGYLAQSLVIKSYTANEYSSFDTTPQNYAGLYDMCQADTSANVRNDIAQVHQVRPDFKALLYRNLRSVLINSPEYSTFVNNDWILKDSSGNPVPEVFSGAYMVDIGNPAVQNWIANYLNTTINSLGYDGVFGDNGLFWGAGELFYGTSTPINPRTNMPWTDAEARQALISLHNAIKSAIGSNLLLCNGIYDGQRFFWFQSAYEEIFSSSHLDGFMSEGGWYPVQDLGAVWATEEQWLKELDFLVYVQDNFLKEHPNRFYVPMCLLRNTAGTPFPLPQGCTQEQMATYAYASTLLGAKTDQNYLGLLADSTFNTQVMQPLHNADIGSPTNDYYIISGTHIYARDFTKGKVLVNPTNQPYSLMLTKNYRTLGGQIVSSINVEAHTGVILSSS